MMKKSKKVLIGVTFVVPVLLYLFVRQIAAIAFEDPWITLLSKSEDFSRQKNLFIGTYFPNKDEIKLKDGSSFKVPVMWVEHQWINTIDIFFRKRVKIIEGYNAYFPFGTKMIQKKQSDSLGEQLDDFEKARDDGAFSKYFIRLNQEGKKITDFPGMAGQFESGFHLKLDETPDSINIWIMKKGEVFWERREVELSIVDSVTYSKQF